MNLTDHLIGVIKKINPNYSPSVIIDCGSRNLDQSIEFSNNFPKAKILAFEANPSSYQECLDRAKNYDNISVYPYAISDKNENAIFHITTDRPGTCSLLEPDNVPNNPCGYNFNKIIVKCIRLDDFLREIGIKKVDILWMDIQGGELAALRGYGDFIHNTDFIECESSKFPYYKNHPLLPELEKFYDDHNFVHSFHMPWEGPPHNFIEGELVCINKKIISK